MSFLQGLLGTSNGAPSGSMNPQQHAQAQQFMSQYGQAQAAPASNPNPLASIAGSAYAGNQIANQNQQNGPAQAQMQAAAMLAPGAQATSQGQANMGQMGAFSPAFYGVTAQQGATGNPQGVTAQQGAAAAPVSQGNLNALLGQMGTGAANTANVSKLNTNNTPQQIAPAAKESSTAPTWPPPAAPGTTTRTTQPVARQPATPTPAVTPGKVSTPAGPANIVNPVTGALPGQKANIQGNYNTDPNNSAYQLAYDPGKGYSISDPTKGESSYNVNNTGFSPSMQAAINTFQSAFGTPNGAIGNISPAVLAALTGQSTAPAAAAAKAAAPVAAKPVAAPVTKVATPIKATVGNRAL